MFCGQPSEILLLYTVETSSPRTFFKKPKLDLLIFSFIANFGIAILLQANLSRISYNSLWELFQISNSGVTPYLPYDLHSDQEVTQALLPAQKHYAYFYIYINKTFLLELAQMLFRVKAYKENRAAVPSLFNKQQIINSIYLLLNI